MIPGRNELVALDAALKEFSAHLLTVAESAADPLRSIQAVAQQVRTLQSQLADSLASAGEQMQKLSGELASAFKSIAEAFEGLPEGIQSAQSIAADRGWFWGHSFVSLAEMAEWAKMGQSGDADALEDWMVNKTRAHLSLIRNLVLSSLPARSGILSQAFEAHEAEHYGVSIPTMLAQADGIYQDLFTHGLFYDRNLPVVERQVESALRPTADRVTARSISMALMSPLFSYNAMWDQTKVRDGKRTSNGSHDPLNRPGVLHGVDTDYATERKALCVVALLGCLASAQGSLARLSREMESRV